MTRKTSAKPDTLIETDWSVLDDQRAEAALHGAARYVAKRHEGVTTEDDLRQEGSILCATSPEAVRNLLADEHLGERALCRWLIHRLLDATRTDANRAKRHAPLDAYAEHLGE